MLNQSLTTTKLPKAWFASAANVVQGNFNESLELNSPSIREALEDNYCIIILMFGLIIFLGTPLNLLEIYFIIKNKFHKDATSVYFLNLAVTDIVKCVIVIPFSLMSLLYENWFLGEFLCYFLPMLQDVPAHVTVLTFLMIVFDRYLFVRNPAKARLPGFIFSTGAWLTAICIALPYPIYTTYVSLEDHVNVSHAVGAGICIFGVDKAMKEYSRGIFVGMFVIPLAVIMFIFYQIYQKLEEQDQPIVVEGNEIRLRATFRRYYSIHKFNRGILSNHNQNLINRPCVGQLRTEDSSIADQFEIDPKEEEKRVQMFLWSIVISFVACFGPLNTVSKMIYPDLHETYETAPDWDKLFVFFCWIAFLSTIITPLLVFSMIMNDEDKNILKSYLNLCKRRSSVYDRSFELEENFANVAYISHPSATTLSTEVGAQSDRPYLKTRN